MGLKKQPKGNKQVWTEYGRYFVKKRIQPSPYSSSLVLDSDELNLTTYKKRFFKKKKPRLHHYPNRLSHFKPKFQH